MEFKISESELRKIQTWHREHTDPIYEYRRNIGISTPHDNLTYSFVLIGGQIKLTVTCECGMWFNSQ